MQDTNVRSPVTGGPTRTATTFDARAVVERYQRQGYDVSRYYAGMDKVPLMECVETGYRFFHPQSLAGEASFYESLYDPANGGEDMEYRKWSEDYQFALDSIMAGERVLDMGCGYGYFLDRAAEKADAIGIDGNPHAQRRCQAKGLDVRLGSIQDYAQEFASRFDVLTSFQVLEHIYDVRGFLSAALAVVRPGGRLLISVPNNEPYIRRFDKYHTWNLPPHHVGHWDLASLRALERFFPIKLEQHQYCETSDRWVVDGYLRARGWMGVTSEIHEHTLVEKAKILAAAPLAVTMSAADRLAKSRPITSNVVAVVFRKG